MDVLARLLRALIFATTFGFCVAIRQCSELYGTGINPEHCNEAVKELEAIMYHTSRWGITQADEWFSRDPRHVGTFYSLPRAFVSKTCSIGIDIANHPQNGPLPDGTGVKSGWSAISSEIAFMLKECVHEHGVGGTAIYQDIEVIIINPQAGIAEGTCLDHIKDTQCL